MKKVLALVLALVLAFSLCVTAFADDAAEFDKKYTWSIATTYATGSPMVDAANVFAEKLAEYSNGAITLNVFPDSTLYADEMAHFTAVQAGDLEFCLFGASPALYYTTDVGYLVAPFLYNSMDEFNAVYYSDTLENAKQIWREQFNLRDVGGMVARGFRNISCNTPVNSVEDLAGVKLRLPGNNLWIEAFNSLGAVSISIPLGELYTSLQNGAADASDGPWEQMATNSLYEVQKYVIETRHYMETAGFWMDESLYESLPENYQAVVDKAGAEALKYMEEECAARDSGYLKQLTDNGCEYLQPDLTPFFEAARPYLEQKFATDWTAATYDEVLELFGR